MTVDKDLFAALSRLEAPYAPTPLLDLPELARRCGVGRVLVKDESKRPLGNFKSLGGLYAGLRALARAAGLADVEALLDGAERPSALPALITASDGNHGLSVATAAQLAGAPARIYLPAGVQQARVARIAARGAEIVHVPGTYDEAVDAAAAAAARGEGLLVADTSDCLGDPAVTDVMAGYGLLAREIADQCAAIEARPTHAFVQAGVGGLPAALAEGLAAEFAPPPLTVVVEPAKAACVARALAAGRPVPIEGALHTSAEMLACGLASAPAVAALLRHGAKSVTVGEPRLAEAAAALPLAGGPATTPSGACGVAGLLEAAADSELRRALGLEAFATVLLIASEGPVPGA